MRSLDLDSNIDMEIEMNTNQLHEENEDISLPNDLSFKHDYEQFSVNAKSYVSLYLSS